MVSTENRTSLRPDFGADHTTNFTQEARGNSQNKKEFLFVKTRDGGEGGIRTRVGVFSPQTAFEAAPLRPLRYLSGGGV